MNELEEQFNKDPERTADESPSAETMKQTEYTLMQMQKDPYITPHQREFYDKVYRTLVLNYK